MDSQATTPAKKKTALVTGASSGIGLELAQLFAADGHDVVLVARRKTELEALARRLVAERGVRAHVVAEDLSDAAAPERIVAEVGRLGLTIELLVNNAGFGAKGRFAELELGRQLRMIQVNVMALVHLTGLLLPGMLARRSGRILNLGSTAGFQPGPGMAVYYATKAFVNSFTEALAFELSGTGVTATVSCPGATATEFGRVAGNGKTRLFKRGFMAAPVVAEAAYRAMLAGKVSVIHGARNKLLIHSQRLAPRAAVRAIAARLNLP
ncbi:MAG TPA: SDR family oxidoreductase [Polyangia bacterium]|jgi:short-subunit dehydrogenase|nr:SDR family oxidoreductase [Polyangia bacterium]